LKSSFGRALSNLVALLQQQLFVYRDLWVWIDDPFQPPPIPAGLPEQLAFATAGLQNGQPALRTRSAR
jgi:hypothetical protein